MGRLQPNFLMLDVFDDQCFILFLVGIDQSQRF